MDNATLQPLLQDSPNRQFWIKPVGNPDAPPTEDLTFTKAILQIDFAKKPTTLNLDDLLFVYAVGRSKLLYIADCYTPPREATDAEIQKEPWRNRWRWSVKGHNFTPIYGSCWGKYNLKPFELVREYNLLHPQDMQNLGAIQHGQDKQRISRDFGMFLIQKIMEL